MKGEFSRSTFSTRMRYGSVTLQQGRVELDTNWNEKSELQINGGLVYLDVWERDVRGIEAGSLIDAAAGGPSTSSRKKELPSEAYGLRMVRDVALDGRASSTLHTVLGRAAGRSGESYPLPELEISVEGVVWKRVKSFSGVGPNDQVYATVEVGDLTYVKFGNGKQGAKPDVGSRVVASYRFTSG